MSRSCSLAAQHLAREGQVLARSPCVAQLILIPLLKLAGWAVFAIADALV